MTETLQEQVLDLRNAGLTQVQVAEKLGISQQYVSKLERSADSGNDESTTDESTPEYPSGTPEYDEPADESSESDSWTCTKCGTGDWYSADEYLAAYGDRLENQHIALLMKRDKVCAGCGGVF